MVLARLRNMVEWTRARKAAAFFLSVSLSVAWIDVVLTFYFDWGVKELWWVAIILACFTICIHYARTHPTQFDSAKELGVATTT